VKEIDGWIGAVTRTTIIQVMTDIQSEGDRWLDWRRNTDDNNSSYGSFDCSGMAIFVVYLLYVGRESDMADTVVADIRSRSLNGRWVEDSHPSTIPSFEGPI
jgi:hypothetical protein